MKTVICYLLIFCSFAAGSAHAGFALTSDVGVTLSASPTTQLATGQPINFTMTVTNYGPDPIPVVEVLSSMWLNQISPISYNQSECTLVVLVLDGVTPSYSMSWIIAGLPGQPVFAAGETRTCHFSLSLTAAAPAAMSFDFGLPSFIPDTNPANDTGTVLLQRAIDPIPTLSSLMLLLLSGLLVTTAGIAWRSRSLA
jgi:Domain of unknown function DUF11